MASIFSRYSDDPDDERMSFGDHLEELRRRLIYGLIGFAVAVVICFNFGGPIIETLTTPYSVAMHELGFDPQMVQLNPVESFVEYFKIAMEFALVLAAPWLLYQLWLFVAAGLYPSERRLVRLFAPTSIALFIAGAAFMIMAVLAGLLKFLIQVSMWFPLPSQDSALYQWLVTKPPAVAQPAEPIDSLPVTVPVLDENPVSPRDGEIWISRGERRLIARYDGETYYMPLKPMSNQQFVQPFFSISEYLGFVVNLALAFGIGFQIPIVVVFLIMLGIVPADRIGAARRFVLLGVAIFAAVLTPTPDVATMMMLAVPMYGLFEAGLLVGRMLETRKVDAEPPKPV